MIISLSSKKVGDSDLDQKNTRENADLPIKDVDGSEKYDEICFQKLFRTEIFGWQTQHPAEHLFGTPI